MTPEDAKPGADEIGVPRCSACGATELHHLEYVRKHGLCVV